MPAPWPTALRRVLRPVPPRRAEPDAGPRVRPRARRRPRPPRLRRGLVRRAPLGRLRDHRLPGDLHRRRRRAHEAHQARHRRRVAPLPPPLAGGRPAGPARPPHPRPHDLRRRPGRAADRRLHHGHRPGRPAPDDGGVAGGHPRPAAQRRAGHARDRLVHDARGPPAVPALHPPPPRGGRGRDGVAVGAAPGRAVRRVAAVAVDVGAGGLRRRRPGVERRRGAGRQGRATDARPRRAGGCSAPCTWPRPRTRPSRTAPTGWRTSPTTSAAAPASCRWPTRSTTSRRRRGSSSRRTPASGNVVIGTPDDAIAYIEGLIEQSGGFGTFLLLGHDWADPEATMRSYRLFAREVIPHFTGPARGHPDVARLGHRQAGPAVRPGRAGDPERHHGPRRGEGGGDERAAAS